MKKKDKSWEEYTRKDLGYPNGIVIAEPDDIENFIRAEVNKVLDSLETEELNHQDMFYGKGEIEHGFEHAYNQAVEELNAKIQKLREEYK